MFNKLYLMIDMKMKREIGCASFIVFSRIGLELPYSSLAYNQQSKLHLLCCVVLCMCWRVSKARIQCVELPAGNPTKLQACINTWCINYDHDILKQISRQNVV